MSSAAESTVFWLFAPVAVLGALGLLFARKSVHAAIAMVLSMVALGVFYLAQDAEFLGVIQVFVYSGAVMMLFLFVVMLVGVDSSDSRVETIPGQRWAGGLLAASLAVVLCAAVGSSSLQETTSTNEPLGGWSTMHELARLIFSRYVWVFEVLSALLITAALGAMVLAHREQLTRRPTQADWARRRIQQGQHVTGMPAPGVFARHNAADVPALQPDGSVSEHSVPRVLRARGQVAEALEFDAAKGAIDQEIQEGSAR